MYKPSKHAARNALICRAVAGGQPLDAVAACYALSRPAVRQMIQAWWKKNAEAQSWPPEHRRATRQMAQDLVQL